MLDALSMDLTPVVADQPDPLLFATVSGAHLYGFPSRDSDVDLRGVHLLSADELLGLREVEETRSRMWDRDGVEMDLVTHDLRKFCRRSWCTRRTRMRSWWHSPPACSPAITPTTTGVSRTRSGGCSRRAAN
ncbi:hypothetical protein GCM10020367_12850 [Streptomyces sannanensis]|uniref:Nucleotidyltransferase domain-containing protein n=1 Tax=Streptomyces sannanensis TaxID=285536 RepID=A0ABP6S789_9ACTN